MVYTRMLLLICACFTANVACHQSNASQLPIESDKNEEREVLRGKYIAETFGCVHCHTPKKMTDRGPVPDETLLLSGFRNGSPVPQIAKTEMFKNGWVISNFDHTAHVGPWGISYSANITPDPSGIGNWSLENFIASMRQGKHKGQENGRMVMPPMPWTDYIHMSDDDIASIYAYLQTVKPIENRVPSVITIDEMD